MALKELTEIDVLILATMIGHQVKEWGHSNEIVDIYLMHTHETFYHAVEDLLYEFEDSVDPMDIPDNWDGSNEPWDIVIADDKELPLHLGTEEQASKVILAWRFKILEEDAHSQFKEEWKSLLKVWVEEEPEKCKEQYSSRSEEIERLSQILGKK